MRAPFRRFLFFFCLVWAIERLKKDRYLDIFARNSMHTWAKHCPKFCTPCYNHGHYPLFSFRKVIITWAIAMNTS